MKKEINKNEEKKSKKKLVNERKKKENKEEKIQREKDINAYKALEEVLMTSDQLYNRFHSIKISVASPEKIKSWGYRPTPVSYREKIVFKSENQNTSDEDDDNRKINEEDKYLEEKLGKEILRKLEKNIEVQEKLDIQITKSFEHEEHVIKNVSGRHRSLSKSNNFIEKKDENNFIPNLEKKEDFYDDIGEIFYPETVDMNSNKVAIKGLFCPYSFGPIKDWECLCGKFTYNDYRQLIKKLSIDILKLTLFCPDCGGEINDSRVRRYRMGYILFNIPIIHYWYFTGTPKYLQALTNTKTKEILPVVYCHSVSQKEGIFGQYSTIMPKEDQVTQDQRDRIGRLLRSVQPGDFETREEAYEQILSIVFTSRKTDEYEVKGLPLMTRTLRRGCELIVAYLENLPPLSRQIEILRRELLMGYVTKSKLEPQLRRLRILESFMASKTNPIWIFFTVLPVLPPDLRPLLELESGRLISADLNYFYENILKCYLNRLTSFKPHPKSVVRSTTYLLTTEDVRFELLTKSFVRLQIGVDQLIDNARVELPKRNKVQNLPLKSLTENLEAKEGRFRLNLYGKRSNYSSRTVIIPGPFLRVDQCGLPYEMAKILFYPLLTRKILEIKLFKPKYEKKIAEKIFARKSIIIWKLLVLLVRDYAVLLNRAPTLHKFGIQAFEPVIHFDRALQLHPLVCTGFNADFDGDQMGIYLPLYLISQSEIQLYMKSSQNYFLPTNGDPVVKPTQDMVIGSHYLTSSLMDNDDISFEYFSNQDQVIAHFYQKRLSIHTRVFVNYSLEKNAFFEIQNNELFFFTDFLPIFKKKMIIEKIFYSQGNFSKSKSIKKIYFFTNLGIVIGKAFSQTTYQIINLFLETTPGRILFEKTIKDSIHYSKFILEETKNL